MKRDMDVVRQILMAAEELAPDAQLLELDGLSREAFSVYTAWLFEAGLVQGGVRSNTAGDHGYIDRLSWQGCEFLDAARSNTLWSKAKQVLVSSTVNLPLAILKEWLESEIKRNLPSLGT